MSTTSALCAARSSDAASPQVAAIETGSRQVKVVGYTCINLFANPADGGQPVAKSSVRDYVLNAGAFQLPLHPAQPPTSGQLTPALLAATPRLPCSSLLLRILTTEDAKAVRHVRGGTGGRQGAGVRRPCLCSGRGLLNRSPASACLACMSRGAP